MIKLLLRFARGTYGVWSQLRRLTLLVEWNLINGITVHSREFGTFTITGSLPPSKKDIRESEGDTVESIPYPDEERLAEDKLVEYWKKRKAGEKVDEDDPASDFELL